ncbi:MAG: InlB B-repeat-containing protein [Oscillospiraceae bacterium]|nr:InlB B-repeat-containing protein [Oscillospiraceae bacterium]
MAKNLLRRITSVILTLALMFAILPAVTLPSLAAYNDADGAVLSDGWLSHQSNSATRSKGTANELRLRFVTNEANTNIYSFVFIKKSWQVVADSWRIDNLPGVTVEDSLIVLSGDFINSLDLRGPGVHTNPADGGFVTEDYHIMVGTTAAGLRSTAFDLRLNPIGATVTYDRNGAAGTDIAAKGWAQGELLPLPDGDGFTPPEGKEFKGWGRSATGVVADGRNTEAYIVPDPFRVTGNVTLFAIWGDPGEEFDTDPRLGKEPKDITVTYNSNSANGGVNAADITNTRVVDAQAEDETKRKTSFTAIENTFNAQKDKEFSHWSSSATDDSGALTFDPGDEIADRTESLTLYAIWAQSKYTTASITYNLNGGTGFTYRDTRAYEKIDGEKESVVFDIIALPDDVSPPSPAHTFAGWSTSTNYHNWDSSWWFPGDTWTLTNQDVTLYAIWRTETQALVTIRANPIGGGTSVNNINHHPSASYIRLTNEEGKWTDLGTNPWFRVGPDTGGSTEHALAYFATTPWGDGMIGTNRRNDGGASSGTWNNHVFTEDTTIYGIYGRASTGTPSIGRVFANAAPFEFTRDSRNYAYFNPKKIQFAEYNAVVSQPLTARRWTEMLDEYQSWLNQAGRDNFLYWAVGDGTGHLSEPTDAQNIIPNDGSRRISNDYFFVHVLDIHAVYSININFKDGGGGGTMNPVANIQNNAGNIDDGFEYTLPASAFTAPAGKRFAGWSTITFDGKIKKPGEKITVMHSLELTAMWEDLPTAIATFDGNGGRGTMEPVEVMNGEFTYPECGFTPPSTTAAFVGWAESADGRTGRVDFMPLSWLPDSNFYSRVSIKLEENKTFYAIWSEGGGGGGGSNVDVIMPSVEKPEEIFINLTQETITLSAGYKILSYSVDGGTKWKALGNKEFDQKLLAKLLGNKKGTTLWIANKALDKEKGANKGKPVIADDTSIIKFPKVNGRAALPKLAVNYALAGLEKAAPTEDGGDLNLGKWTIANVTNKATPTAAGDLVAIKPAGSKPTDAELVTFASFGHQPIVTDKAAAKANTWFVKVNASKVSDTEYVAPSKTKKFAAKPAANAPKAEDKKGVLKLKAGTAYTVDGGDVTTLAAKADIEVTKGAKYMYWTVGTDKKPPSQPKIFTAK